MTEITWLELILLSTKIHYNYNNKKLISLETFSQQLFFQLINDTKALTSNQNPTNFNKHKNVTDNKGPARINNKVLTFVVIQYLTKVSTPLTFQQNK